MGARQSLPQNQPIQPIKKPEFITLSKEEALDALAKANKQDFFIDEVAHDELNRKARANLHYMPVEGPTYVYNGPQLKYDVNLIWMHTTAEGGMPHTRPPNLICMPIYYPSDKFQSTLVHELVHIDQRLRTRVWIDWCIKNGWTLIEKDEIPGRWLRRCRLNPDTVEYRFWAYKSRWVPLPMYEREDTPKIREVRVKWWDRKTGELLLDPPAEIRDHIDGIANPEHPFEIAAYKELQL
jgi:hypothetical protein